MLRIAEAESIQPIKTPSQSPNASLEMGHGLVTFQNHLLKIEQVILILLSPLGELPDCRMLPTHYRLPLPFRSTEFTY